MRYVDEGLFCSAHAVCLIYTQVASAAIRAQLVPPSHVKLRTHLPTYIYLVT